MTNFETILKERGVLAYTNRGVSMMPLLRQGKDILVVRTHSGSYQKDDAVLFKRANGQYILHRITKVNGDGSYIIIGDNCPDNSAERIREEQILGILTEVQRNGKTIRVTDRKYLFYVKTVPLRRKLVKPKRFCRRALSKVYHLFFKKKG